MLKPEGWRVIKPNNPTKPDFKNLAVIQIPG